MRARAARLPYVGINCLQTAVHLNVIGCAATALVVLLSQMYLFHLPIYRYYLWFKAVPTDTNIHFCSVFFDSMTYQEMWALIACTILCSSILHDIAVRVREFRFHKSSLLPPPWHTTQARVSVTAALLLLLLRRRRHAQEDYRQGTNACVESLFTFCASIGKRCSRCCKRTPVRKTRRRGGAQRRGRGGGAPDLLRESVATSDGVEARVSVIVEKPVIPPNP